MSTPAEALDQAFSPPPVSPANPPPSSATAAPVDLANAYQAHSDTMRGAAAADELDAASRAQPKDKGQTLSGLVTGKQPPKSLLQKAEGVAEDVGEGVIQTPRAAAKGIRDAYQAMIDLAGHAVDFAGAHLPAPPQKYVDEANAMSASVGLTPETISKGATLPDLDAPTSVTGTIEKNVVQFLTGLATAGGQLKALGMPAAETLGGKAAQTALKGFLGQFEAFDGSQANLSNLVQSEPKLANPVTEFLATSPDNGDAVNRLKSAIEGTIGGQLVDGFVNGLKFLRNVKAAKSAVETPITDLDEDIGPPTSSGISALGDPSPDAPIAGGSWSVSTNNAPRNVAEQMQATAGTTPEQVAKMGEAAPEGEVAGPTSPGATEAQAKEPGVYVNFNRIDGPDDVKRAMSQLADAFKGNIDDARRGVQTFEDTKLGADAVNAWDTLMSRRVGEPLNAEQSLAARQLWASSAAKTMELAGIATETPTPENLFAFRKMLATHAAIQEQVIAARTETARALSSWRIPAGGQEYRMAQVLQGLKQGTGGDGIAVSIAMAQRVKALQEAMDVDGLNNFAQKGVYATTRDAVLEAWTNGLLTAPITHVKVTASNAATVALRLAERYVAERAGALTGSVDGVALGETGAAYSGLVSGLKDAFRYAGKAANAFLNEQPLPALGDDPLSNAVKAAKTGTYSAGEEATDHAFGGAISSQAFGMAESGWLGQGVDLLGQLIRSPGRALTAEHDFFRSIAYRMELQALATRQASQEVQAGKITAEALESRRQEIVGNPPPSVTLGAQDAMKYQTFTDAPGKLAQLIEQARNDFPMLRVILPFYKIPARILSFTFERTPFAPLMSAYQANIAAGGARASLARAQMGLGTMMMLATADAVMSGQITGSGPPQKAQRGAMADTGWLPYSMKVGDHWVQYNRLETSGSAMAMAADIVETMKNYSQAVNGDDPDIQKLVIAATLSVAQDITSKTYLQGLSNAFETIANPKTEGEANIRSMAGSAVPAGLAAIDRVSDPYQRAVYSMLDAIKARTPGLSESLPPRRNVWGEPIEHASGLGTAYDLLSPFATRQPTDIPIDREIQRLGVNVTLPAGRTGFGQGAVVDLQKDPALYSRYVELAGNAYKDPAWGMGAKDMLNDLVSGKSPLSPVYDMKSDGPDGGKAEMIRSILNQYRDGAKRQLLKEYPKLQDEVTQKAQDRQALKMPSVG